MTTKTVISFSIFILIVIVGFVFTRYVMTDMLKGRAEYQEYLCNKNSVNLKKVKIGMDTTSVLNIMGKPSSVYIDSIHSHIPIIQYSYITKFRALMDFSNADILFDDKMEVAEIRIPQ